MLHVKFENHGCSGFREQMDLQARSHSGEKVDFNGLAIFRISRHLGSSTRLTVTGLKPCSLIMLHVKFESHRCSGFREKSFKWT